MDIFILISYVSSAFVGVFSMRTTRSFKFESNFLFHYLITSNPLPDIFLISFFSIRVIFAFSFTSFRFVYRCICHTAIKVFSLIAIFFSINVIQLIQN